jgi:predicted PurR-regulated permease PerM
MLATRGFNDRVKQVIILLVLAFFIYLVLKELHVFFPGLLGAITLYILSRKTYFQLIYHRKWRRGWTAGLYLLGYFSFFVLLVYAVYLIVEQRIRPFLSDPATMLANAKAALSEAQQKAGITLVSEDTLNSLHEKLTAFIPGLLNDTGILLSNFAIMLFILYYMLVHGKEMELFFSRVIPLEKNNVNMLAAETKRLVKASALGIPIISMIQGITATIGYAIFGVKEYGVWGFLTGVFAFFPILGTLVVWVPLVTYMYIAGHTGNATALLLYSLIVTGNIDYVSRITLLEKFGHVHPVVTVLGVIVGLGLFGFIGLIFGPLLVNYVILLFRIYLQEFGKEESKHAPGE